MAIRIFGKFLKRSIKAFHFIIEDELVTVISCFHHRRDPVAWDDASGWRLKT